MATLPSRMSNFTELTFKYISVITANNKSKLPFLETSTIIPLKGT